VGNELILDDAAEALFKELGGTDTVYRDSRYDLTGLTETLHDRDRRLDPWRVLLMIFTREIASFFESWGKAQLRQAEESLKLIDDAISKLHKMPESNGRILITHQGRGIPGEGRASLAYDFVVSFGPIRMDLPQVRTACRRLGITASEFPQQIVTAFDTFGELGINSIYLRLGDGDAKSWQTTLRCLTTLGAHFKMLGVQKAQGLNASARDKDLPFIVNSYGEPDPNLASLAVINKQNPESVASLVERIAPVMLKPEAGAALDECTSVYEAIFAFKKLKDALVRPPVEINNLKWLLVPHEDDPVLADEVKIARMATSLFGSSSQECARLLDALYATDFRYITPFQVVDRIGLASRLVEYIAKKAPDPALGDSMIEHIVEVMEARLDMVKDSVISALEILPDSVSARIGDEETVSSKANPQILERLSFFRDRTVTKGKVKSMLRDAIGFSEQDYSIIARDFGVSPAAAQELIGLLKSCFDSEGHFLRGAFEKRIPAFCNHEEKVFEFLWHFLKEHMHKSERIGFLNSLKVLIDRMSGPSLALYTLLTDFAHDPESVTFSDRNALMLCNVLLRTFNKELHQDIEMTPEEVIQVVNGINPDAVDYARDLIDHEKEQYFLKFRYIHRLVRDGLDNAPWAKQLPMRYLLTLEREVYMLFALVGGITGKAILRSGLREFGDPESGIYELPESLEQLPWILQILQVLVRAMGRLGERNDLVTLREIRARSTYFLNLKKEPRHTDQVKRLMLWTDKAADQVSQRLAKE
jgi:hypothetical protein